MQAYMRGGPLPGIGTFQEKLMSESVIRERNERFAVISLFSTLLCKIGGVTDKSRDNLLETYKEELYQLRYNYKYKTRKEHVRREKIREAAREARIMKRVDKMTVTDEDITNAVNRNQEKA